VLEKQMIYSAVKNVQKCNKRLTAKIFKVFWLENIFEIFHFCDNKEREKKKEKKKKWMSSKETRFSTDVLNGSTKWEQRDYSILESFIWWELIVCFLLKFKNRSLKKEIRLTLNHKLPKVSNIRSDDLFGLLTFKLPLIWLILIALG